MTKICLICSASFEIIKSRVNTAKYCGDKCRGKAMSLRGNIEVSCNVCNALFSKRKSEPTVYCSQVCMGIDRRKSLNGSGKCLRKLECGVCSYDEHPEILGIHHIDHNHSNNSLYNLMVICANCHSLEHKRHIVHGGLSRKVTLEQLFHREGNYDAVNTI